MADPDEPEVLLVEDNPGDVRLVEEAFESVGVDTDLSVVRDGEAALAFLFRRGEYADAPRPNLVLLDLNLPRRDGMTVLDELKDDPDLRRVPVVVLTGSEAPEDVAGCYERHAAAYLTKPVDPQGFVALVESLADFWFSLARLPPTPDDK